MANIFTNAPAVLDFEAGDLSDYDTTGASGTGVNTCVSSPVKYGSHAHEAKITSGASSDYAWGRKDVTWPAGKVGYVRCFMRIMTAGTYNGYGLITAGIISGASWHAQLLLNPATLNVRLHARDSTGLLNTGLSFSVSLGVWYEIEIKYDISGSNAAAELFKDGMSLGTWTGTGVPVGIPDYIRGEVRSITAQATLYATVVYDHIEAADRRIGSTPSVNRAGFDEVREFEGRTITLAASAARTANGNGMPATGIGFWRRALALLEIAESHSDAADTLDVYVDVSPDGGATWLNAVHFTQQAGNGAAKKEFAVLDPWNSGTACVDATADAAAGAVRSALFGDAMRARWAIVDSGDADQSHTFSVKVFVQ
jgi:hypothetical protein